MKYVSLRRRKDDRTIWVVIEWPNEPFARATRRWPFDAQEEANEFMMLKKSEETYWFANLLYFTSKILSSATLYV